MTTIIASTVLNYIHQMVDGMMFLVIGQRDISARKMVSLYYKYFISSK